jgi:Holliday junction resolvasome RuvABC endonuclease subunit
MAYAGIDLSLTSPAMCIFHGNTEFTIEKCTFSYLADIPKRIINTPQISGKIFPSYTTQYERYENISTWIISTLLENKITKIYLEDYSYGSTGRVFHIAENTGVLKYLLWKNDIEINTVPPTVVKKTATGKGNANKEMMQEFFIKETGLNIKNMLSLTDKQWNPSSDLIDSYYVCKYGSIE